MASPRHPLFETELPIGWRLVSVDDIKSPEKSACVAGPFGSNISSKFFVEAGVPVIRGNNLRSNLTRFVPEGFAFVTREQAARYKAQHVKAGDLVFTCWGTVGQVGLIPKDGPFPEYIISNKQLKLRPNPEIVDAVYLFYYCAGPKMVQHVLGKAIGAAVPGINLGILKGLPIVLPPLPTQRKIAAVLSAYDDLIENNTRRIKILEQMAQAIYREWFVTFRFPGHEKVRMVNSPMGKVPEGWRVERLTDAVDIDPPTRVPREGAKPFVPMGCLSNDSMIISDIEEREGNSGSKFKNGDTLFARITPCLENGKTGFVQFLPKDEAVAFGSTEFIVMRSKVVTPEYVYLMARSTALRDHAIKSMSGATGRQRVQNACFDRYTVAVPTARALSDFTELVRPMFMAVFNLAGKNANLRRTRDLLLPKLISGEVDVSELDIAGVV